MACPGSTPCLTITAPAGWTFSASPVNPVFQDARLIGLREADATGGTALVALDPVTGTLNRPAAQKGVWQHDPAHCGPDFVGDLNDPAFASMPAANAVKAQHLTMWETECDGTKAHLVKSLAVSGDTGILAALRSGPCGGGVKWAKITPSILTADHEDGGGVVRSPRVIGYRSVTVDGNTEHQFFAWEQWHQATVPEVTASDDLITDDPAGPNLRMAVWKKMSGGGEETWGLQAIPGAELPRLVNRATFDFVDPPFQLYSQEKAPGSSVTTGSFNLDLSTHPQWDAAQPPKGALLHIKASMANATRGSDVSFHLGGFRRSSLNLPPGGHNSDGQECTLPVPESGIVVFTIEEFVGTAGTSNNIVIYVHLLAFIY